MPLLRPNSVTIYRRTSSGVSSTGDRVPTADVVIASGLPAFVNKLARGGQVLAQPAGLAAFSTHVLIIDGVRGALIPAGVGPGQTFTGPDGVTVYTVTGNGLAGQIDLRVGDKVVDENGYAYLCKQIATFDAVVPTLQAQLELGAAWISPAATPASPPSQTEPSLLPPWSTNNVELTALNGKSQNSSYTGSELAAIGATFPSLFLNIHNGNTGYYENQSSSAATNYKTLNPSGKWLFYVGFHGQRVQNYWYWTYPGADPSWVKAGGGNVADPNFRDWWTSAIAAMLVQYPLFDGVIIDSLGPNFDPNKYAMLVELRSKIASTKLVAGNCFPSLTPGATYFDGAALHMAFGEGPIGRSTDPVQVKQWLDAHIAFGKAGWPQILRCWPGFSFLDGPANGQPPNANWPPTYGARIARAKQSLNVDFALAAYLMCSYPYTYLSYGGWGYDADGGDIPLTYDANGNLPASAAAWAYDGVGYPDLLHALGAPISDATHPNVTGGGAGAGPDGYIYNRSFPHVIAQVNLHLLGQVGQAVVTLS